MPSEQNDVLQGSLIHTHFIFFLILNKARYLAFFAIIFDFSGESWLK